jgi:hypothetical protein
MLKLSLSAIGSAFTGGLSSLAVYAVAALLMSGAGFVGGWKVNGWRWEAALAEQKQEASRALNLAKDALIARERAFSTLKDETEVSHARALARIDQQTAENRRLVRELGGLRDPGRGGGGGNAMRPDPGAAGGCSDGAAEGRLSDEAAEFLLGLAAEADRAAAIAATCRAWAIGIAGGTP